MFKYEIRESKAKWIKTQKNQWINLDMASRVYIQEWKHELGELALFVKIGENPIVISYHHDLEEANDAMDKLFS